MTCTYTQAVDEIHKMFFDAWNAGTTAIVGYIPNVQTVGIEKVLMPESGKYFCDFKMITLEERQKTLSSDVDSFGKRRYNIKGNIQIQIFSPLSDVQNFDKSNKLGVIARNAYRGKSSPSGIQFHNAKIVQLNSTEVFSKIIVIVDYNYDDIA